MEQPLVSIITPAHNAEAYIAETIKSVQDQIYTNWEMLITDDASTDQTPQIIEQFAHKDSRIKFFKLEENTGPAAARNYSTHKAQGRFIAFIDADDVWHSQKLAIQVKTMMTQKAKVSFSNYQHIDEDGLPLNRIINAIPYLSYAKLLKNNYIGNLTGMYDASKLGKLYQPHLKKRQDWCLWLEALKISKQPAVGIQKVLAKYRLRKGSISKHKVQLLAYNFQVYHRFLKFNVLKSTIYLIVFLVEYFFIRIRYIDTKR